MSLLEELKDIVALSKETGISLSEANTLYREYKKVSSEDKQPAPEAMGPEKTEEQDTGKEQPAGAQQNEPQPK